MLNWKRVALGSVASAAVIGALIVAPHPWAQADDSSARQPVSAGASAPSSGPAEVAPVVPSAVVDALQSAGVHIRPAPTSATPPVVPGLKAIDIARGVFMQRSDPTTLTTAALATVTVDGYGPELQSDPSKPSVIAPEISNKIVWVVSSPAVTTPIFGKVGYAGPSTQTGRAFALVDPATGDFLYGMAY